MAAQKDNHLFVLIHGLWGGPHHLKVVEEALVHSLPDDNIYTLRPMGFAYFRTYDGVKHCGNVVLEEIFNKLIDLRKDEKVAINKISFVGYSFGGLVARYCIGELMKLQDFFHMIEPVFFTTFATPHLGVRFFDNSLFHAILNTLGTTVLGQSGKDLFIADKDKLLLKMADPEGPYYQGLALFQKRILLANVHNDRSVPFYTGFITKYQPFIDWEAVKLKYIADLPAVEVKDTSTRSRVVDITNSFRVQPKKTFTPDKILRYFLILLVVMFILPIWLPVVFTASSFGTIQSAIRRWMTPTYDIKVTWQKLFSLSSSTTASSSTDPGSVESNDTAAESKPRSHSDSSSHLIEGEFAGITENYVEGVLAADDRLHGHDLEQQQDEESSEEGANDDKIQISSFSASVKYDFDHSLEYVKSHDEFFSENNFSDIFSLDTEEIADRYPLFQVAKVALPLGEDRTTIMDNLNSLPFLKLPVFIESFNAHDGIVSRRGAATNPRGTATILLWCSILKKYIHADEN